MNTVTLTLDIEDTRRLGALARIGRDHAPTDNANTVVIAYVELECAKAMHYDTMTPGARGIFTALNALNEEPAGIDLWHEHRGTVRTFDATEQDPT